MYIACIRGMCTCMHKQVIGTHVCIMYKSLKRYMLMHKRYIIMYMYIKCTLSKGLSDASMEWLTDTSSSLVTYIPLLARVCINGQKEEKEEEVPVSSVSER